MPCGPRADDREKRVLVDELVESVTVFPDHLEVNVAGVPRLNVAFDEVGLKQSGNVRRRTDVRSPRLACPAVAAHRQCPEDFVLR
jgi:hypothetical protein